MLLMEYFFPNSFLPRPVVKNWCYGVTPPPPTPPCSDECLEAARQGECPRVCEVHRGDSRCCGTCSRRCVSAARRGQCLPECEKYRGNELPLIFISNDTPGISHGYPLPSVTIEYSWPTSCSRHGYERPTSVEGVSGGEGIRVMLLSELIIR